MDRSGVCYYYCYCRINTWDWSGVCYYYCYCRINTWNRSGVCYYYCYCIINTWNRSGLCYYYCYCRINTWNRSGVCCSIPACDRWRNWGIYRTLYNYYCSFSFCIGEFMNINYHQILSL